jgi:hypothetical protein
LIPASFRVLFVARDLDYPDVATMRAIPGLFREVALGANASPSETLGTGANDDMA